MGNRRLVMWRHPEVALEFRGRCYGQTDVPLSPHGEAQASMMCQQILACPWTHLIRSPARRTALPFPRAVPIHIEPAVHERHFGTWEGRDWQEIYAETGNAMDGFIHAPATFAPPGGETTFQLRDRVQKWYHQLPASGFIVVISHGGPIAALRGVLANLPVTDWPALIPKTGEAVVIE